MQIHFIQHVPFETPAWLLKWTEENKHIIHVSHLYKQDDLPDPQNIDILIIMGGPMGIYDEKSYPWLKKEKKFIHQCIKADKLILGICLGAQLIADVLGAKIIRNQEKEIGWFPIQKSDKIKTHFVFKNWNQEFIAFHWHGDTFAIPEGALPIGYSKACKNQGFIFQDKVIGLQFHLESTEKSIHALIENCRDELSEQGNFIQKEDVILELSEVNVQNSNHMMSNLLENWIDI